MDPAIHPSASSPEQLVKYACRIFHCTHICDSRDELKTHLREHTKRPLRRLTKAQIGRLDEKLRQGEPWNKAVAAALQSPRREVLESEAQTTDVAPLDLNSDDTLAGALFALFSSGMCTDDQRFVLVGFASSHQGTTNGLGSPPSSERASSSSPQTPKPNSARLSDTFISLSSPGGTEERMLSVPPTPSMKDMIYPDKQKQAHMDDAGLAEAQIQTAPATVSAARASQGGRLSPNNSQSSADSAAQVESPTAGNTANHRRSSSRTSDAAMEVCKEDQEGVAQVPPEPSTATPHEDDFVPSSSLQLDTTAMAVDSLAALPSTSASSPAVTTPQVSAVAPPTPTVVPQRQTWYQSPLPHRKSHGPLRAQSMSASTSIASLTSDSASTSSSVLGTAKSMPAKPKSTSSVSRLSLGNRSGKLSTTSSLPNVRHTPRLSTTPAPVKIKKLEILKPDRMKCAALVGSSRALTTTLTPRQSPAVESQAAQSQGDMDVSGSSQGEDASYPPLLTQPPYQSQMFEEVGSQSQ